MYESPSSLQDACLDYICENIAEICEAQPSMDEDGLCSLAFSAGEVFLPSHLSDYLLASLCEKNKLTDQTMTLFDAKCTSLKRVRIRDVPLTLRGLRMLKPHKIVELEAMGLKNITVNDLVGCLGEWSLANLRHLNVGNSTFLSNSKFLLVVSLSKLHSLQTLNVSYTEFNERGLEIIAEDLPCLESLDISSTPVNDLTPLRKCKQRLRSLSMYNLRASHNEDIVPVLAELTNLHHLDVSDDFNVQPFMNLQPQKFKIQDLLLKSKCFPRLVSLDISGKESIPEDLLREFLGAHPDMQFLGLALTDACEFSMFTDKESATYASVRVTGEASEVQLMEALKCYKNRPIYVQKTLYYLFNLTQQYVEPRLDIMKLILPAMAVHPKELGVQMAATACLYNLSKAEMGQKTHPHWLGKIVHLTMDAMQNFPNHPQLQKNALLTLCSDRILQDVSFDRFRCAHLVMECLCSFDDASMNRMSVAICGILAAKIPTDQTSKLGAKATYMKKLLAIVEKRTDQQMVDTTMKFTLSALWNLTDESPQTCKMFINEGGLELFLKALHTYGDQPEEKRVQVETKVLGLVNNLAEVPELRKALMRDDILDTIRGLLRSPQIDVSYFAAGIVSHLVSDGSESWDVQRITREEMLNDLGKAVLNWKQPQGEMVAYRSFSPFFPLLTHFDAHQIQLWALWAMQHVCMKNSSRYCPMLVQERGDKVLEDLMKSPRTHPAVAALTKEVLEVLHQRLEGSHEVHQPRPPSPDHVVE